MKYRKKPVVIEAVQFDRSKAEKDVKKYYPMVTDMTRLTTAEGTEEREDRFFISDLEGNVTVSDGDYIYRDINGKFYLCQPDIFEETYEVVNQTSQLNDNQKIVLEWLKEKTCKCNKPVYPMNLVRKAVEKMPVEIVNYYDHLSDREEFEVLAAFAQWGLEGAVE